VKLLALALAACILTPCVGLASSTPQPHVLDPASTSAVGTASWYGEAHRGKPMANGDPFDPEKLTAASWFFPLGTTVEVRLLGEPSRAVQVKITDRGPARELVRRGRLIDLSQAAFRTLTDPRLGLISVVLKPVATP
jgi:rare lipoprotein A